MLLNKETKPYKHRQTHWSELVQMYVHARTHTHTHAHTHPYAHTHTHTHTYTQILSYNTSLHIYIYIYIYCGVELISFFNQVCLFLISILYLCITLLLYQKQDAIWGRSLSRVQLVWIQSFPFFKTACLTKVKLHSLPNYLIIAGRRHEIKKFTPVLFI